MNSLTQSPIERGQRWRGWYVVFVLQLGYFISFIDRTLISLLVAPIELSLGLDDRAMALLQGAAFGIFYALMGYPMGLMVDRLNRRNLVTGGSLLWCLATAASGLAAGFRGLFAARLAIGFGESSLSPAAVSLIGDLFPPARRAAAVSAYQMAGSVGVGLALVIGGRAVESLGTRVRHWPILGAVEPWRIAFLAVGLAGLIVPILMAFTVAEPARDGPPRPVMPRAKSELWAFLRANRRVIALHLAGFSAINTLSYGQLAWTPELFRRAFGWTMGEIGLRYGLVFMLSGAIGVLSGGWAATWLRSRGHVNATMLAMTVGALGLAIFAPLAPLAGSGWMSLALFGPVIFFFAFPSGVSLTALADITPGRLRGRVIALYYVVISLTGLMFGPSLVSEFEHLIGTQELGAPLAWDAVILAPIAVICFAANLGPYRRAISLQDSPSALSARTL